MLEPVQVTDSRSKDIKQKYKVTFTKQLRDELFGSNILFYSLIIIFLLYFIVFR